METRFPCLQTRFGARNTWNHVQAQRKAREVPERAVFLTTLPVFREGGDSLESCPAGGSNYRRLVPESDGPAVGAASARDWQLWLADARRAAAAGQWREAIHFVYWAAISRLESKRLWPADRARTPREYLSLVAAEDPR